MNVCAHPDCFVRIHDGRHFCPAHRERALMRSSDDEQVEALQVIVDDLQGRLNDRSRRSGLKTASAVAFAVAASAAALATGAGFLGVVFVSGCVAGIACLSRALGEEP